MKKVYVGATTVGAVLAILAAISTGCSSQKVEKPLPGSPAAKAEAGMRSQMADEFHRTNLGSSNTNQ